jgi:hypothetical protein
MHLGRDFQAQRIQPDEAGGVVLVVGLGRAFAAPKWLRPRRRVGFHRGGFRWLVHAGGIGRAMILQSPAVPSTGTKAPACPQMTARLD